MSLQFFSNDESEDIPADHHWQNELERLFQRRSIEKWLKERGYEQRSGSTFRLRISIVHDHKKPQYFDHWVGMDTAAMMSFEELEKQDMKFWMEARSKAAERWKGSESE